METFVETAREGRAGRIILNRGSALNALDLAMLHAIDRALTAFEDAPEVELVIIESASERAFCAGGDIRVMREHVLAGDTAAVHEYFSAEYGLNRRIAEYSKPFIALVDGICMGGGIGISVHGTARVASERAQFGTPETGIGLFPDCGATWLLPRMPGALGLWLGLTRTRLQGPDAAYAGFATHYVPRARFGALETALAADGPAVLAAFAEPLAPCSFAPLRAAIDRCFGAPSVAAIAERLANEGDFGRTALAALEAASPASLLWSFEIIKRNARRSLPAALTAELHLVDRVALYPDFAEGVRAAVVTKDHRPRWRPARLEEVDPGLIARMFEDDQAPW